MTIEDMLPALEQLDTIGYYSLECWGGATFDACMRFLNEDPWERLRTIRKHVKNTKLQMLFRGQNILGYKHYADDVVDAFCAKSIENGIDIIRIFDALNDVRNLEQAIKSTKKYGGQVEATLSYTISPIHSEAYFVKLAKELEGWARTPSASRTWPTCCCPWRPTPLVKALKETVRPHPPAYPQHLRHRRHDAADGGLCRCGHRGHRLSPPWPTAPASPPPSPWWPRCRGTVRDTGLSLEKMSDAAVHFRKVAQRLQDAGILDPKVLRVDTNTLLYQVPGGMLSNLISQLKQAGKEDKYYDVLAEIPRVRKDFGYPPLVTPSSQIVGTQAVMNVIMGERYKTFPKESRAMLKGEYGKLPGEVNEEVRAKAGIAPEDVITCRPADLLEPELEKYREEFKCLAKSDEDVLSLALFPRWRPSSSKTRRAQGRARLLPLPPQSPPMPTASASCMWSGKLTVLLSFPAESRKSRAFPALSFISKKSCSFRKKKLAISAHIDYNNTVNRICTFSSVGRAPDS